MSPHLIETVIYAAIALFFPIIPAYVLYRALPSRTRAYGPFKSLNIQLTGAFAGYFLLFITIIGFITASPKPVESRYDVWEVKGKLALEGKSSSLEEDDFRFSSVPPAVNVNPDGSFTMAVATRWQAGATRFPTIIIESEGHESFTLDLDDPQSSDYGKEIQWVRNGTPPQIKITKLINLPKAMPPDSTHAQDPARAYSNLLECEIKFLERIIAESRRVDSKNALARRAAPKINVARQLTCRPGGATAPTTAHP